MVRVCTGRVLTDVRSHAGAVLRAAAGGAAVTAPHGRTAPAACYQGITQHHLTFQT